MTQITLKKLAIFCVSAGSILRLVFPYDIEFKYDQKLMLDWIIEYWNQGQFRSIGMMSGGNVYNFGLGVWIFYLLGWFSKHPVGLTMIVAAINVASLWLFYFFIKNKIDGKEKETWYWSLSLLSVSILPIILSRNIWIQSILPPFTIAILYFYWSDLSRFKNSFLLAMLLVLIGQIHLSGIFLCAVVSVFLLWFHIKKWRNVNVLGYALGGSLAALPALPLLIFLFQSEGSNPTANFGNMIDLRILWFHIFDGLGLDIFYTLESDTILFFSHPLIDTKPTYINGVLYGILATISFIGLLQSIRSGLKVRLFDFISKLKINKTYQFVTICLLLYSLLYLLRVRIYSHYFIISYPFIQILAVILMNKKRALLCGLILTNFFLSIQFLYFIHSTGGTANSYYGITYQKMMGK